MNFDTLEKFDVVKPDGVALDVQSNLVHCKLVGLGHLLVIVGEGGLGLLDVEQVGFPQVNVQNPNQTALKQLTTTMNLMPTI